MTVIDPLDFPALRLAWLNLWRNKLRTGLATLGIVIGVIAIAAIGITGTALQYGATQELGGLSNTVTVFPGEENEEGVITDAQVDSIERVATGAVVAPQRTETMEVASRSERRQVNVQAVSRPAALYDAAEGTIPSPMRSGALLNAEIAAELGVELGQTVSIGGRSYRVIAILDEQGGFGQGVSVVVPLDDVDMVGYDQVTVVAADGEDAQRLAEEIPAEVNQREEVVGTFTPADIQESVSGFFATLNAALLGVGSISLLVAGVSILNVMLMSVIERQAEIGVFRAVGIRRREVMRMIVAEAALLGVVGGAVGVALSTLIGYIVTGQLTGQPMLVFQPRNLEFLALGFGFAVAASTLSGLYPAWKASTANPVEVLRG
ncbi:ABC transporter permease [Haloplanus halophilus]|uniref:ABC transporter permease n=1 Tax=Haloplanus halophilus TaxID=2949993 RepID=UPI00203D3EC0|nr:ABC transporter permease [Haloplanus sp. GDY1]